MIDRAPTVVVNDRQENFTRIERIFSIFTTK